MSLQSEKLRLIQLLLNTENPTIIEKIKLVFQKSNEQNDIWDELSETQKNQIDKALEESLQSLTVDYNSFMDEHRL